MQRISSATTHPLFSVAATRLIEQQVAATLPVHTLMQRAGLSVARLALAVAPHASCIWVACGPGNNGGDGFEAAMHLHQWGKAVTLTWTGLPEGRDAAPPDAEASRRRALAAGLVIAEAPPDEFDLCIDALLGIGGSLDPARAGSALMTQWLALMDARGAVRLSVDVPTGLNADTGSYGAHDATTLIAATARNDWARGLFCLNLLTLKPGMFTAYGRDAAGEVWFDDLGVASFDAIAPCAWLRGGASASGRNVGRASHANHKGSFGDVAVVGGESTASSHMTGAALLAARAALYGGAGRVFVALLNARPESALTVDITRPELMFRSFDALDLKRQIIVCGCGGGEAVKTALSRVLSVAQVALLDADALNAISGDPQFQSLLKARHQRGYTTVLTPHPLEAARLLGFSAARVQDDRLAAAQQLARQFACVVVLKGSGTVIAAPGEVPVINLTGNALLATAGTGDVLAGMLGARLARAWANGNGRAHAFSVACQAVRAHGLIADQWALNRPGQVLTAGQVPSLQ